MAQGKKSFIAYADWKDTFNALPNEEAGILIKHIFAYVNDENPTSESILINAVFANIKTTLKRDLQKWESQINQRSEAGKKSAEKRASTKSNDRSTTVETRERNPTDNVSVSVTDNVIEIEKQKTSLNDILFPFDQKQWLLLTDDEKKERSQLLIDEMKNSYNWQLKVCRLFSFSEKKVQDEIKLFMMERDAKNELWKDINDLKSYFISKLGIKYKK